MSFTFNSRETYLSYKEEWKQRYAAQSKKQRDMKHAIREKMRSGGPACREQENYLAGILIAKQLISERHSSKEEAALQWEARKHSLV